MTQTPAERRIIEDMRKMGRNGQMSDVMLQGVLNMPLPDDPTEIDLVTWVQFKNRAKEAADRILADAEVIEALKAALADIAEGEPEWPDDPAREWQWCRKRAKEALAPFSTAVEAREKGDK